MSNLLTLSHAKKLRFLRKSFDRKQSEIAEALNLSQQAYSKLENGETIFTDSTIERIATYFNITAADFEKQMDSITIGNNNSNTGSNIQTVDLKLVETLQKAYEQNTTLLELLIKEKDARISYLESNR